MKSLQDELGEIEAKIAANSSIIQELTKKRESLKNQLEKEQHHKFSDLEDQLVELTGLEWEIDIYDSVATIKTEYTGYEVLVEGSENLWAVNAYLREGKPGGLNDAYLSMETRNPVPAVQKLLGILRAIEESY